MQTFFLRWFPPARRPAAGLKALEQFYRQRLDYTRMSAVGLEAHSAQIALLKMFVRESGCYLDLGCGSGRVAHEIAKTARVVGFDYSDHALENARRQGHDCRCTWVSGSADKLPFCDASFDGVYSFEVFEHLWNPEQAVVESIRITRPGGFILLSMPNGFSLDLHLRKSGYARSLDLGAALVRRFVDLLTRKPFWYSVPDLEGPVYADCDRVTSVVPENLARFMSRRRCRILFWDTYYLYGQMHSGQASLGLQRQAGSRLKRHYGDHLLLLAMKV